MAPLPHYILITPLITSKSLTATQITGKPTPLMDPSKPII